MADDKSFKARAANPVEANVCMLIEQVASYAEQQGMGGLEFCVLLHAIAGRVLANHDDSKNFKDVQHVVQTYLVPTLDCNYMAKRQEIEAAKKDSPDVGN